MPRISLTHSLGFNGIAAARVFVKLMKRLGHERFFVHGGDWGNLITRLAGIIYPEKYDLYFVDCH